MLIVLDMYCFNFVVCQLEPLACEMGGYINLKSKNWQWMIADCDCLRKKIIPLCNWPNHVFLKPLGWHFSRLIFYYCFITWWWWRHWLIHCIKKQRIVLLKFLKRKYLKSSRKTSTLYSFTSSIIQLYYSNSPHTHEVIPTFRSSDKLLSSTLPICNLH